MRVCDDVENGLIEPVDEFLSVSADVVVEPTRFHDEPDAFDGVEFWTIGGKVVQAEAVRTDGRMVIAGIVDDQDRLAATVPVPRQKLQELHR